MFRWLVRGAAAALALGAVQSSAQEPVQLSAESFTRDSAIWSGTLSPDGRYVAAIQQSSQGDVLTIIDWRTRTAQITQLARRDRNLRLDWVAWKNDNRVVFSLTQEPVIRDRRIVTEGSTRVYASNRDGTNITLMEAGGARHASAYAPIFAIDLLHNRPTEILLGTYSRNGFALYRANIDTGRVTNLVDFGEYNTAAMYVDGNGYPVMRVDYLTDNSGLRIYRRASRDRIGRLRMKFGARPHRRTGSLSRWARVQGLTKFTSRPARKAKSSSRSIFMTRQPEISAIPCFVMKAPTWR